MDPYFLYVEDDEDDVVLMKDMMQMTSDPSSFVTVRNGFEAIRFLQNIKKGEAYPAFILMDIQMPRLNGRETLEYLKTDDVYCLIPVLIFSVSQHPENKNYFSRMRTEILPKPGNFTAWKQTLNKIKTYMED